MRTRREPRQQTLPVDQAEPTVNGRPIEDIDSILDDIDTALEDNALETIRSYRQRGGQ